MSTRTDHRLRQSERRYLSEHRVGRLATVDRNGRPHVVPVCFALAGDLIFVALDEKPKTVEPRDLQRVRNLNAEPEVALVVDDYAEDWQQLSFVMVRGTACLIEPFDPRHSVAVTLLRAKYPQYRTMAIDQRPLILIDPKKMSSWSWAGDQFPLD